MLTHDNYHAAVLSDLHLRAGLHDDFVFDTEFAELLLELWSDGVRELVLNGDTFEFPAMWPDTPLHPNSTLGFTERESVERMSGIGEGHPGVFEALRQWIGEGGTVVFLPGNHDWELHFHGVRKRLAQMIGDPDGKRHRHVLHGAPYLPVPGVHIEHGHQLVHDQNAFLNPMAPIRVDPLGGPPRVEQNAGSYLVRTLVNPVEQTFPFINNIRPFGKVKWIGPHKHALRLFSILSDATRKGLEDGRIPRRFLDLVLSNGPFRQIFGAGRAMRLRRSGRRQEEVVPELSSVLADDSTHELRRAARRRLQRHKSTQFVIYGHSHEHVNVNDGPNRVFARRGRAYLNPGSWIPHKEIPDDHEGMDPDELIAGTDYPYHLGFVRVRHGARSLEARTETFAEGEVWLGAEEKKVS
jgi:UDP-2,3-diacylglucosamine pyrophosphatase LpxH